MPRDHISEKDRVYVERVYPTRYHALAFIPGLVPVHICAGIGFLALAFYIRWDYEDRGYRLFPKKKAP